eukprot:TCONS_00057508-protein
MQLPFTQSYLSETQSHTTTQKTLLYTYVAWMLRRPLIVATGTFSSKKLKNKNLLPETVLKFLIKLYANDEAATRYKNQTPFTYHKASAKDHSSHRTYTISTQKT